MVYGCHAVTRYGMLRPMRCAMLPRDDATALAGVRARYAFDSALKKSAKTRDGRARVLLPVARVV